MRPHHLPAAARRLAPPALAAALLACRVVPASQSLDAAPRPARTSATTVPAAPVAAAVAAWAGTFDILADGFPEGERGATMTVARADTGFVLAALSGPPGRLVFARFAGDSAHVLWDLGTAEGAMSVWMRAAGDSLSGTWIAGDQQGRLRGRRRP